MPASSSKPTTKPCRICANPIPAQASYCTHCDSYQNWRRHLQFGQTTLPLLVALVAVLGALVPPAIQLINRPNSRLVVSGLSADAARLNLTFSNLGDRPGVIDRIALTHEEEVPQASRSGRMTPVAFLAPDDPVVAPGEARKLILAMALPDGLMEASWVPEAASLYDQRCTVTVATTAFDGSQVEHHLPVVCREVLTALSPVLAEAFRAVQIERLKANAVPLTPRTN